MQVNRGNAERQRMIPGGVRNAIRGHCTKIIIAFIALNFVISVSLVIVVLVLATRKGETPGEIYVPGPQYARYLLQAKGRESSEGRILRQWEMTNKLGKEDILSEESTNGTFTVREPGFYDIRLRVTFYTTSPFDKCTIYLNGEPLETQVGSSHRQVGNKPEKSDVACHVSRYYDLEKGNMISIGVMSGRQKTVVAKYTSFEIKRT